VKTMSKARTSRKHRADQPSIPEAEGGVRESTHKPNPHVSNAEELSNPGSLTQHKGRASRLPPDAEE
jgi:hypothetical protein